LTTKLGLLLIFIVSSLGFYYVIDVAEKIHLKEEEEKDLARTEIIVENLADRFDLFLEIPKNLGVFAQGFYENNSYQKDHTPFIETQKKLPELLGISYLASDGLIFKSYPFEPNKEAIGKISQNLPSLQESYQRNQKFWASPPFSLFQGEKGFSVYAAIETNGVLQGWLAPIITIKAFERKFSLGHLFEKYGIIITDVETGRHYLSNGVLDSSQHPVVEKELIASGRKIHIYGWNKAPAFNKLLPSSWQIPISLFIGSLITIAFFLYFQRLRDRSRLKDIRMLLQLTGKDAFKRLIGLQNDFREEDMTFFVNLIEQVDLLQSLVSNEDLLDKEELNLGEILNSQMIQLQELLDSKFVFVKMEGNFEAIRIKANRWLFENLIIGGVLTHTLMLAKRNTTVKVTIESLGSHREDALCLNFISSGQERISKILNRRLIAVIRAIQMEGGDIQINPGEGDGISIRLIFKKSIQNSHQASKLTCLS
jgi:hypothetical protein